MVLFSARILRPAQLGFDFTQLCRADQFSDFCIAQPGNVETFELLLMTDPFWSLKDTSTSLSGSSSIRSVTYRKWCSLVGARLIDSDSASISGPRVGLTPYRVGTVPPLNLQPSIVRQVPSRSPMGTETVVRYTEVDGCCLIIPIEYFMTHSEHFSLIPVYATNIPHLCKGEY